MFPGSSTLFGKLMRLPLCLIPTGLKVPILSGKLRGFQWITGSSTHGCWLGTYERNTQKWLSSILRPGDVFLDIGANVGFFTLFASRLVGRSGHVYAFEPLPRNLQFLHRHLSVNHITNVTVFDVAVCDFTGETFFNPGDNPSMGTLNGKGPLNVRTLTLDDLMDMWLSHPPRLLKIDVEGAEDSVILGARGVLSIYRPAVFLSAHGSRRHEYCKKLLLDLGYEIKGVRDGTLDGNYDFLAMPSKVLDR